MTRREVVHSYISADPLPVLALWEPWAILCVAPDPAHDGQPPKAHETRHWFTFNKLPLKVVIHATAKFDKDVRAAIADQQFAAALRRCGFYPGDPRPFEKRKMSPPSHLRPIPLGALVGVATITGIFTAQTFTQSEQEYGVRSLDLSSLTDDDRAFGVFEPLGEERRFAWRLEHAVLFETPVPHSGRQEALYALDGGGHRRVNDELNLIASGVAA